MGRPRRTSSLGEDIRGDTSAPGISTMSTSHAQRAASRSRRRALSKPRPPSKSRARSFFTWYREISYRRTWINPLVAMALVMGAYGLNPTPENPLHACIFLSYPEPPDPTSHAPTETQYGKGMNDFLFVLFYTFFFSFTREFLMQQVLRPLAIWCGIAKKSKVSRFMEQTYTAIYFSIFGPFGLYVMSRTPIWYFNTTAFYERYPHYTHTADFKTYYLLQAAYWSQQAIVLMLQLEKPRKDFKELVLHHIVTLSLIGLSYRFHFTWIGVAVFVTHDISDFFLATSKTLNYLDHPFTGPYFAFFILVWIYMRHYINLKVIWSILTEYETVGVWELDWVTQVYKCRIAQVITGGLLGSLQAVNLFWLWLILKIAWRYAVSNIAQDERSDDEDEEEESSESVEADSPKPHITCEDEQEIKKKM
ncbi:putative ceramide synthase membrane component (LAG1) [Tuber indicum]|nr:putative ceramide synthase membrane component (LAG1) [Tuber indicum]